MKKTDSQILLVARTSLGTINHTLLSLAELERQGLGVMGVVMNGPKDRVSREAIEYYGKVRVLAEIEPIPDINPVSLKTIFDKYFKNSIEG
jgi:dethiobiotin synthetase